MANLRYKTRGNTNPKGKPRVYFCCHTEDFEKHFQNISDVILDNQDCAIWHNDGHIKRDEEFYEDLKQMQLFVMPVTTNLLCSENAALNMDFRFAVKHHIPVLPLMQESGLEKIFNQRCGELQFLDQYDIDDTAISFEEKLAKYLETVLIGNELAERIRAAFDAYAFLSYRKKDRRYAQELMRLIHKNDFCRDIAIWYDEFLTPGDNFNDSIKEALQKSGLFVLTVTPNLVNETNYIMTTEYPMAKQTGKPILPAEIIPTDRELLIEKYAGIPMPADAHNDVELSEALLSALEMMAIKENDSSPEHNYLIGLAYLGGVDVEVDYARAVELITLAAEAGLTDAMEKLIDVYETGMGVAFDYSKIIFWQRRLYNSLKEQLDVETTTETVLNKYGNVCFGLANNLKRMGYGDEAVAIKREYYDFYEAYKLLHCKDNQLELAEAYDDISSFLSGLGLSERAKEYAEKAFSLFSEMTWECDKKSVWLFINIAHRLIRLCDEDETAAIFETVKRNIKYVEQCVQKTEELTEEEYFEIINDLYEDYAAILKDAKQYNAAQEYYIKSYSLVVEKIDYSQAIDRRLMERFLSILHGLKSLNLYEENESKVKDYAFQIIDSRLKYINAIEQFESDVLRRARMISEQYSEIVKQYRYLEKFTDAAYYAEKHFNYLENISKHNLTIEMARLIEMACSDVLDLYKAKERLSLDLSGQEKQHKAFVARKRIEILNFILEQYRKNQDELFTINKISNTLADLIEVYLTLGDIDTAIGFCEEKLKLLLERYDKTKFLSDAYYAYYDASDFYKKIGQHEKAIQYLICGLEYEEREIKGHFSRENQEGLAHMYQKIAKYYFYIAMYEKGYEYYSKALKIRIDAHKTYNDRDSAKSLYYTMWDFSENIEEKFPESAKLLRDKMVIVKMDWSDI